MCRNVTTLGIEAFAANNAVIEKLNLSITKISDQALVALSACTALEFLCINSGRPDVRITDAGCSALRTLTRLTELDLDCLWDISDAGIVAIAPTCTALKSINLRLCRQVGDEAVQALAAGCPNLADVNLGGWRPLSDAGVQALGTIPVLQRLTLAGCREITDLGIIALTACKELEYLDLMNVKLVTDTSIVALADSCTSLERILLWGAAEITDRTPLAFVGHTVLGYLSMVNCPLVTLPAIDALRASLGPDVVRMGEDGEWPVMIESDDETDY